MFGAHRSFNVFNVACGRQTSLNQLFAELQKLTQSSIAPNYAPPRAGDIRHSLGGHFLNSTRTRICSCLYPVGGFAPSD
jgi:UDP-glucose 4-epimerase